MSLREVERIFGCKGTQASSSQVSDYGEVATYSWDGNTALSSITATFKDTYLKSKAQVGLQ